MTGNPILGWQLAVGTNYQPANQLPTDRQPSSWTFMSCPECKGATINLLSMADLTGRPPYDHDKYGAVYRIGFNCGECMTTFGLTFIHRRSGVVVELEIIG